MMEPIEQLKKWGYRTEVAQEHDGFLVYFVEGFGMSTYVRSDDEGALAALANEDAHIERAIQLDETADETSLRWHNDPDNEYELPPEQVEELQRRVNG